MALAATYFELREPDADDELALERTALEWLEEQSPPRVFASEAVMRTPVTVFVPVNDSTKADQLFADQRNRQPRYFPTSVPHNDVVYFVWEDDWPNESIGRGLERLAMNVTRLGHSSSLVQVWIESGLTEDGLEVIVGGREEWRPSEADEAERHFRVVAEAAGTLQSCELNYNLVEIEKYVEAEARIKTAKGKERSVLKKEFAENFPSGMPASIGPPSVMAIGYRRVGALTERCPTSCFDDDLMILSVVEGPAISLESTLQIAGAVRKKIHDAHFERKSPEWLGGHKSDGSPSDRAHLAVLPLPHVGRRYAAGHLLGIALAFPRDIGVKERAVALKNIFEPIGELDGIKIGGVGLRLDLKEYRRHAAEACELIVSREERLSPPLALRGETWTRPCSVWETVTPIVLDRYPKKDRQKQREKWLEEVAEIVSASCLNIDLPKPWRVHIHHNAYLEGVPKARPKGGGFPVFQGRTGNTRFQVHARIEFETPVVGPVILGAGRFVGYGFCRPNIGRCKRRRDDQ